MSGVAAVVLAIITQNQSSMRASPRDSAPQSASLWAGEVVEVRGSRGEFANVYDHRLERGGYVRSSQLRTVALTPESAPELLAVMRFLRDTPGQEALGMSYGAAYLKAVAPAALTPEPFDAIGSMADRLARRASEPQSKAAANTIAAQLDIAAQLGVKMQSFEREGGVQICYDGDMFRAVLRARDANADQRARAALALTRHECVDPALGPTERGQVDEWRAAVLDQVPMTELAPELKNRIHMRRAGVESAIAFWQIRHGVEPQAAGTKAVEELAAVNKGALDDDDQAVYADAAVRVGASRLAAELPRPATGKLAIRTQAGATGETCVELVEPKAKDSKPLVRRCTFGTVWANSARSSADGMALTLSVQNLATWREMWVFRHRDQGWSVDVLPPGGDAPDLGYIESAGWEPDSKHVLVVREIRSAGHYRRRFERINLDTLLTEKQAGTPDLLPSFGRWADPQWRATTVALR